MRFSVIAVLSAIASVAVAAPIERRAAFVAQSYPQFQISGGVAGNALAEANKVFVGMSHSALLTRIHNNGIYL
jgi:hypothetical protein